MALEIRPVLERLLYGMLFVVLLPAGLLGWAYGARVNVSLPAIDSPQWGAGIACAGVLLWGAGVLALWLKGGGLPMNAFPPPNLVTGGIYAFTSHPIYLGFMGASLGIGLAYGSAAAQWLVLPTLALAAAALWWGYERIDLRLRLGYPSRSAWLNVPIISHDSPRPMERLGSLALTLAAPALAALMLHAAGLSGAPSYLQGESGIRAWATLALVVAGVFVVRTCADLRNMVLTAWVGSLLLALLVLVLPAGPFGGRISIAPDGVMLALLAMTGLASVLQRVPWAPSTARLVAALIAGLFLVGRGVFPSTASALGAFVFVLARTRWTWWKALLRVCERIANCWSESDFGAVRIIHIGWLAALPAFGGAAYAVILVGPGGAAMTAGAFVFLTVGAALWAQLIEGSPALSRPYGFFGGVLAVIIFALSLAPLAFDTSPWIVLACFATVAPWAQGLARLRCFANGCCHGAPCGGSGGVVYSNPHTRVVRLAHLGGVPIHPTQLYSLTGNLLIGALMMRLWAEGVALCLITGVYFSLMGLARFVEEAWRGEPQTPAWAGLRLYQWVSIVFLVAGAALTVVPGSPRAPEPVLSLNALWTGLAVGTATWMVVSVDFPRSNKRFARLA